MANDLVLLPIQGEGVPIVEVRGQPVVLANDLARLFEMSTGAFNQQVKRNIARFDGEWCFSLTDAEFADLKSRNVISSGWGGVRYPPWAFTEQGMVTEQGMPNFLTVLDDLGKDG